MYAQKEDLLHEVLELEAEKGLLASGENTKYQVGVTGAILKEYFNILGRFVYCHKPHSHVSRFIPFYFQCLLFLADTRRILGCSVDRIEGKGSGLPPLKLVKYTVQQIQNALVDKL